jgi:hypothetical protein
VITKIGLNLSTEVLLTFGLFSCHLMGINGYKLECVNIMIIFLLAGPIRTDFFLISS